MVVSGKTTDYGSVKQVSLVFKDDTTNQLTQSVTIYHKDTNEVEVISVQPVEQPVDSTPGEEGEESVDTVEEQADVEEPEVAICIKPAPIVTVPQVLISEVIKTDKVFEKIVTDIQKSETVFSQVIPVSVQVEKIDEVVSKYVTVMEAEGTKKEIVTLYNSDTEVSSTISTKEISKDVVQTYSKEETTSTGEVVYRSNNVAELKTKFNDFRFVLEETQVVTQGAVSYTHLTLPTIYSV